VDDSRSYTNSTEYRRSISFLLVLLAKIAEQNQNNTSNNSYIRMRISDTILEPVYDIATNAICRQPNYIHAACRATGSHTSISPCPCAFALRVNLLRSTPFWRTGVLRAKETVSRNCEATKNVPRLLEFISRGKGTF